jgi:hypothetical protein
MYLLVLSTATSTLISDYQPLLEAPNVEIDIPKNYQSELANIFGKEYDSLL